MRREAVLFALLATGILSGQTRSDFIARFGSSPIEAFRIDKHIRLTVEYAPNGYVHVIQIASPDYHPEETPRERDMDSSEVDRLLDAIVPGITEATGGALAVVTGHDLAWSVRYKGFTLHRSYRGLDKNSGKTIRTILTAEDSGISQAILEAQYGSPEYEVFYPTAGLAISITYGAKGLARRIEFRPPASLLDTNLDARPIDSNAVDQFLEEFVPSSQRLKMSTTYEFLSGSNRVKTSVYEGVTLMRAYHGDELRSAVVYWK